MAFDFSNDEYIPIYYKGKGRYVRKKRIRKDKRKNYSVICFGILIFIVGIIVSGVMVISKDKTELDFDYEDKDISELNFVEDIFFDAPERKGECQDTFNELNNIRKSYGRKSIRWNEKAYNFAVARSKDMYDRN